ncbi:hypothetical protein GH714_041562 [Hevea brasiliensis]|uniref:Uncharacterized protein n=1 Tax=Hevea brasiliensis TaxID=3981 RepID=A0A6A6MR06_HEVBR|nr:hypothetical protein GH714_041562 [Hevea brasiliensis]
MLSTVIKEKEGVSKQCEEASMGSLHLATALKDKPKEVANGDKKGCLFVNAKLRGNGVKALVDTDALDNFLKKEEADRLGIMYDQESRWLKAVNSKPNLIFGVVRNVQVTLDEWQVPIPFASTMCILKKGNAYSIPLAKGKTLQTSTLSAMQFSKGVKKVEPSYLVVLK